MDRLELTDKLNAIRKQSNSTYSGAVIKLTDMLCQLIGEIADVHVPVFEVQAKVEDLPPYKEVPKPDVSKPEGKKTRKANKATTDKAKTTTNV
jgi:hypothetical protein